MGQTQTVCGEGGKSGMRSARERGRGTSALAGALCIAALGVGILADAAAVSQGIRDGLAVCGNVLVPSLFPFMVLAGFLSRTSYAAILSAPLGPLTRRIYKLPGEMGAIVLLSMIGGFPVGARMVANLLEDGRISARTASRMLCFCVNCGPSFLISAVGVGMLLNKTAGVILFATQTTATLLVGAVSSRRARIETAPAKNERGLPGVPAFVSAVTGASSSMIVMCAFAILFSGVLALIRSSGVPARLAEALPVNEGIVTAVVSGLFEVTAGCIRSAQVGGVLGFALASAGVSFCGLSVLCQVMSCFPPGRVSFRGLLLSRPVHAALSTSMAVPLYRLLCREVTAWSAGYPPIVSANNNTWIISVCLLAMCSILVLSME